MCVVGAVPPWLQDDPLEGTSGAAAHPQIGPSLQDFLKQSKNHAQKFILGIVQPKIINQSFSTPRLCMYVHLGEKTIKIFEYN